MVSSETDRIMPAEWAPHRAVWLAWPSHADLWLENLKPAQVEFEQFCRSISGERLEVLVPNPAVCAEAEERLKGLAVRFHEIPFGDIWLRDTGPVFLRTSDGLWAQCLGFNGWGGKYKLPFDEQVSSRLAKASGFSSGSVPWILEGGSIDCDGEGTFLTTEQCLLNKNRNENWNREDAETALKTTLGAKKVLWIQRGLLNDHTDGHIDTLVRFVGVGRVVCMKPSGNQDPNREVLEEISADLRGMTDGRGRALEVIEIPSPGRVEDEDGKVLPASYVNFYISNESVVVPIYGTAFDQAAVEGIRRCFPTRKTVGVSARAILSGGGAFHCISQQEPL